MAAAGAAGGRACTDLVVRTWLERPKLLLGAYVSAIAEHDVAVSENRSPPRVLTEASDETDHRLPRVRL